MSTEPPKPPTFQGDLRNLPPALEPMKAKPHWVLWRWKFKNINKDGEEQWTKVPYQPNGRNAKVDTASTWSSYETCVASFDGGAFDGIGFCLLGSGFNAFDVDKCRDRETSELKVQAQKLMERCGDTYAEVTVSGTGIRIIGLGVSDVNRQKKYPVGDGVSVEVYRCTETARYITISGSILPGHDGPLQNIDDVIDEVYDECEAHTGDGNDDEIISGSFDSELTTPLIEMLELADQGASNKHGKYASQSELLFGFLTACARSGVAKTVAQDACLDARYAGNAIHQHCQGGGGSKYVRRQIEKAWKTVTQKVDAQIAQINADYSLVLSGNKASVMKFESGTKFRLLQVGAFRQWFSNLGVTVGKKVTSVGEHWLGHPQRRQYEGIEFEPGGGRSGFYNLWQGFAVQPKQGDCSKFLAHLKENVARGDEGVYQWIVGWWAQIVQRPTLKMETALVLRGQQGTGKSKIGTVFGSLFGDHYLLVANPRYITGQFNSHMASLLLLHADEAFWAGDKKSEGTLKDLVTGVYHMLEFKGVDPIRVKNYIRLFVCGNANWVIPAGFNERRWAIFDMGEDHMQDHDYFAAIDHEMDNGGREALLHHLQSFDLTQVNLRSIPKTTALLDQQLESMTPEQSWWFDALMSGTLPHKVRAANEPRTCSKQAVYHSYIRHAHLTGVHHKSAETKLGMFLSAQLKPDLRTPRVLVGREQVPCFSFPPLKDCRKLFAQRVGQVIDWGEGWEDEEWQHHEWPHQDQDDRFPF